MTGDSQNGKSADSENEEQNGSDSHEPSTEPEASDSFDLDASPEANASSGPPPLGVRLWDDDEQAPSDASNEEESYALEAPDDSSLPLAATIVEDDAEPTAPTPAIPPPIKRQESAPVDRGRNLIAEFKFEFLIGLAAFLLGIVLFIPMVPTLLGAVLMLAALAWTGYFIYQGLSKPSRATPEETLRLYFKALARPLSDYHLMYGCLTEKGQRVPEFHTIVAFRSYWRHQLDLLRPETTGWRRLAISLSQVQVDHGSQEDAATANCVVVFSVGGSQTPAAEIAMKTRLVKRSDEQWYLEDGRLPARDK